MLKLPLFMFAAVIFHEAAAGSFSDVANNSPAITRANTLNAVANRSLHFEPNVGQAPSPIQFIARSEHYLLAIDEQSVLITTGAELKRDKGSEKSPSDQLHEVSSSTISMAWVQGNKHPRLLAEQRDAAVSNYFISNDPRNWHSNVPNFKRLRYEGIYPGIDWVLYGNRQRLEYDFIIAPNADASQLKLKVHDAKHIALTQDGDLLISMRNGAVKQLKPFVYQTTAGGGREPIAGGYKVRRGVVSFAIGSYDHSRALIIDPVLTYSTYVGGSTGEFALAVAVDSAGSAYVGGQTSSIDFPIMGAFQAMNKGDNAFVFKLNPAGDALVYSTYFGGSGGGEEVRGIAVDAAGNAFLTGDTFSHDLPLMSALQPVNPTSGSVTTEGFVAKLNPEGSALVYSTYLGGSGGGDAIFGIAVDSTGSAYVAGYGNSTDYPTTAGAFQRALRGHLNAFVSKLSAAGDSLVYSTYLGGSAADQAYAIAVDNTGEAVVVGNTNSADFPLASPYQSTNNAILNGNTGGTLFVSKLNASGSGLVFSTYLGGSVFDNAFGVTTDQAGNVYLTGQTCSSDFPVVNAFQATNHSSCSTGGPNAFVSKLSATGNALVYSTYLGGSGYDSASGIAVDGAGDAYVVGSTTSLDFPTQDPLQMTNKTTLPKAGNAFVSELNPTGSTLLFSTYLGGSGSLGNAATHTTVPFGDVASALALDTNANIYVAGKTGSSDFPVVGAFQSMNKTTTSYGSVYTAFVAKISTLPAAPRNLTSVPSTTQITLGWSAVTGATSYNLYQSSSATGTPVTLLQSGVQSTSFTVTSLTAGTTYYFEVSAVGTSGEGAKSAVITASTNKPSSGGGGELPSNTILVLLSIVVLNHCRRARSL